MPKPQTLVILSPGFAASETDTTCLTPQQVFVRALLQNYPDTRIIILAFEYPFFKAQYMWFGAEVIAFGGRNRSRFFRLLNWLRIWRKLQQLKKQHELIGLLSFWFDECAFIGHHFAKRYHLKYFSWILGQDAKPGNRYFKMIKPDGGSLIALSDFARRTVQQNYGITPAHTIVPGIDTEMFGKGIEPRSIDILGAGSLISLKQYDVFIQLVRSLVVHKPDLKAVICGNGPEKERLMGMISEYRLEQNIELHYEIPHREVLILMQQSKVFLHTSAYEGFGVVILEALYAGAHVVSFVKPMDELLQHHYVVNSVEEMLDTLLGLLQQKEMDHSPVLRYSSVLAAKGVMQLFAKVTPQSVLYERQLLQRIGSR